MLFKTGIRRLGSKERGFFYRYPGTGETVREERVLRRIENLKVPPAWEDVRIARSPAARVQAIGYDSAGRLEYPYHPRYRERKDREKFKRILRFSDALPRMRHTTSNHLRRKYLDREKVLATMTRLMNAAYIRLGEQRYARKEQDLGHSHPEAEAPAHRGRHHDLRVHWHVGPKTSSPFSLAFVQPTV